MTRGIFWAAFIAVAALGCDATEGPAPIPPPAAPEPPAPPPPAPSKPASAPVVPKTPPEPEPSRITVQRVLVAFKGAHRAPANVTRTQEEAGKLAQEILERVRKGEDIAELAKQFSTDPGGGLYVLVNNGVSAAPGEIPRGKFIKPFVDIAFKLKVGGVGLVEYDPTNDANGRPRSPYGWHVIKRLE